jgi:hypothetical protein
MMNLSLQNYLRSSKRRAFFYCIKVNTVKFLHPFISAWTKTSPKKVNFLILFIRSKIDSISTANLNRLKNIVVSEPFKSVIVKDKKSYISEA